MAPWFSNSELGLNNSIVSSGDLGLVSAVYSPLLTCLRTVFVVITSSLAILGNVFSLVVMRSVESPRFPPSTKVFLCNVIVADMAYGVSSAMFVAPAVLNYWPYGDLLCQASNFIDAWLCSCCVNAAIFITIDRVLAVIYPLRHAVMISRRRAIISVLAATLFQLAFTMIVFLGIEVSYNNNAVMCLVRWSNSSRSYLLRLIILASYSCFIPSLILIGCYAKLYQIAQRQAKRHAKLRGNNTALKGLVTRNSARIKTDLNFRALKMCTLITATFCVAWTPYVAVSFRNHFVRSEAPPLVDFVVNWLCVSNSWWDVIVYFFMAKEFRKKALKLVRRRQSGKTAKIQYTRSTVVTKSN